MSFVGYSIIILSIVFVILSMGGGYITATIVAAFLYALYFMEDGGVDGNKD